MSRDALGNAQIDELTHTKLFFQADIAESTVLTMIRVLQRVPGVLLVDAPHGGGFAAIAHDGGVPISALLQATSNAGVKAQIHPVVSTVASLMEMPLNNVRKWVLGSIVVILPTVIILNIPFLKNTENMFHVMLFLAPLLFILYMAFVIERYAKKRGEQ